MVIKKNKILPLATTWMKLEGIILSGMNQTEKMYCMISLKCRIFKKGSGEGGQVCKCPYKMSQFWASGVRQGNHGSQHCVVHGRDAKRVDLKGSHYTKKKKVNCVK